MNFYDFALCRSIVQAGAQASLFTCDKTLVTGTEGFLVHLVYRDIYGKSAAWMRGLRFCRGSLVALIGSRTSLHTVAHFHFFHVGPLELFNVMVARLLGLRVVITAHDVEAFKQGLSIPIFVRLAYRLAGRVIAHSQIAKRELIADLGIPERKIDVVPHGNYLEKVPEDLTQADAKAKFGFSKEQRILLFFGQIKDVKGLDILLQGFALARKTDTSLHLLVAGRLWKTDFARYAQIIDEFDLQNHCTLHIRYIPDEEAAYFYKCADLVILPYRRIYQSGVVLEAMSFGRPVLVSDIDGMLEAVEDECTGFVFRNQDPEHLAQRIGEIFSAPDYSSDIAQAGLEIVSTRNDWTSLGRETLHSYQRAMHPAV